MELISLVMRVQVAARRPSAVWISPADPVMVARCTDHTGACPAGVATGRVFWPNAPARAVTSTVATSAVIDADTGVPKDPAMAVTWTGATTAMMSAADRGSVFQWARTRAPVRAVG